jgi:sugar/nucleoside kinase (ribokinase family)
MLVEESNLVIAAKKILDLGPSVVIIKKGESGSITFTRTGEMFILPAYPASEIKDPTGAGDSFAGGFMGYLASAKNTDFDTLKKAIAFGTVVASFTISDFSVAGLAAANMLAIEKRLDTLRKLTGF